jgi:hypothetical protein
MAPPRQRTSKCCRSAPLALAVGAILLTSCEVVSVSGPSSGRIGDVLTYAITIQQTDTESAANVESWLTVEMPESWTVVDASFTGVVGGAAIGGTPDFPVTPPGGNGCWSNSEPPPGAQRIGFTTSAFAQADPGDQGTVILDLLVGGGAGDQTLRFDLLSQFVGSEIGGCPSFFNPVEHQVSISPLSITEVPVSSGWGLAWLAILLALLGLRRIA